MTSLVWPIAVLTPQTIGRPYLARSAAGSTAINGEEQVAASPSARWMIRYLNIRARTRAQIIAHDKMEVLLEGRANPLLVPLCEGSRRPLAASGTTEFKANGAAAQGATSMGITVVNGGTLEAGQSFTIGERFYRLRTVTGPSGGNYTVTFRPRLRVAVADEAEVDFENLQLVCRMLGDQDLDMDLEMLKRGTFSPTFVEYMGT